MTEQESELNKKMTLLAGECYHETGEGGVYRCKHCGLATFEPIHKHNDSFDTTDAIFAWLWEMEWGIEVDTEPFLNRNRVRLHKPPPFQTWERGDTLVEAMRAAIEKALSEGGE